MNNSAPMDDKMKWGLIFAGFLGIVACFQPWILGAVFGLAVFYGIYFIALNVMK